MRRIGPAQMMTAVDTSALRAIILEEPDWQDIAPLIATASDVFIRAATLTETLIVTQVKRGARARSLVNHAMQPSRFEVVTVGTAMTQLAYDAFEIYGKDLGHAAQLNFCDTFSYALAKIKNVPLRFKGTDFSKTDVQLAVLA